SGSSPPPRCWWCPGRSRPPCSPAVSRALVFLPSVLVLALVLVLVFVRLDRRSHLHDGEPYRPAVVEDRALLRPRAHLGIELRPVQPGADIHPVQDLLGRQAGRITHLDALAGGFAQHLVPE